MNLPVNILNKLEELVYKQDKKELAKNFRKISDKYIGDKNGQSLVNKEDEALAYAISRMPATYSAVKTACEQAIEMLKLQKDLSLQNLESLVDVGAGTGAATLALSEYVNFKRITCLEREDVMIELGKELLEEPLENTTWLKFDINLEDFSEKFDVVITSYMINELAENKVLNIVDKLWNMTNKILIIVDSGTPKDHKRLVNIKNHLVQKGGNVIAPCTRNQGCALSEDDWCHFVCRVERTKMQKEAKKGDVPFEDEKFTYLVIAKEDIDVKIENFSRVIRHPIINTNMIKVKLCSNGDIKEKIYTKKDKDKYKKVRKARVGDIIEE